MGMGRYGVAGSMDIINGSIRLFGNVQALQSGTLVLHGGYRYTSVNSGPNTSSTELNYYPAGSTLALTDRYVSVTSYLSQSRIVFTDEVKDHVITVEINTHDGYGWKKYFKSGDSFNCFDTVISGDSYRMKFDYAVEDSPKAFSFFEHMPELKVLVFDRPWNRECAFPNGNYQRCADWESIRKIVTGA